MKHVLILILVLIWLLFSTLTIFPAPTYHLWLFAIIVTEYPLLFVGFTFILLLQLRGVKKYKKVSYIVAVLSLLLFSSPIVRASWISKNIAKEISEAFGEKKGNSEGFSLWSMISRPNSKEEALKTLSYKTYPDLQLQMDFYSSAKEGKRPCVVVVHGGAWKSGDSKQLPELNAYLASSGYHVAAINYRLAPRYKSPDPVQDVKDALSYLKKNASRLKIDTSCFVLLGRSAGAQIALVAAYSLNESTIKGVIDFYGPADMVWGYSLPANPLVMDSRKVMEDYLGGKYENVPDSYKTSSPVNYVSRTSPPTLIIHGENDVLVAYEHSIRLQQKLNKNNVKNYFLSLPWATHGFDYHINGPGGQLSTYAVSRFLNYVTN